MMPPLHTFPVGSGLRLAPWLLPLIAAACVATPSAAHAISDPTLLPDGRQSEELRPNERNPFGQQVVKETAPTPGKPEAVTEESRLRRILRAMKISGVSGSDKSKKALLGSLILQPGTTLPPILNNQFEVLRVLSVDDHAAVLTFVERDSSLDSRKIILPFQVRPEVTQAMVGEVFETLTNLDPSGKISAPPLIHPGVEELKQGSMEADLRNIADRDVDMMGVVTNAKKSKEDN